MSEPTTVSYRYLLAWPTYDTNPSSSTYGKLLDEQIIAELPFTSVQFTKQLNSVGTFKGSLLVSGLISSYGFTAYTPVNLLNATFPFKTMLYVERSYRDTTGGLITNLVWGGQIWSRTFNSEEQTLYVEAREFVGYWEKRFIHDTFVFFETDPLLVAQSLATWVGDYTKCPFGDIGIVIGTETSTSAITRTYHAYELKTMYQALEDLAKAGPSPADLSFGFDFHIDPEYGGSFSSGIQKSLYLDSPESGTRYSDTNPQSLVLESPGVVMYEYPEDGSMMANQVYALGGGTNEEQLQVRAQNRQVWQKGFPLVEGVGHFSDVYTVGYLQKLALSHANSVALPPASLKIVLSGSSSVAPGSYTIGDDARVRLYDDYFSIQPLDAVYRITSITWEPGEDGPERITLNLTVPALTTGQVG